MIKSKEDLVYSPHVCKNSKKPEFIYEDGTKKKGNKKKIKNPDYCDRIWIDVDRTGATDYPTTQFYCPECVATGKYKNPKRRLTIEEKEELAEKMKSISKKRKSKKI